MAIRFHLDESITTVIADGLRLRDIDVTTTGDAGLLGIADEKQLEFACKEERVIVTADSDFLRLHKQGYSHAGIIFIDQKRCSIGRVIRVLTNLSFNFSFEEIKGTVVFV